MARIGRKNVGSGVGLGLNGGNPQFINILDTFIPVYDEEVVAFGFGHAILANAEVDVALYDISLGVESVSLVQVFTTITNTVTNGETVFELPRDEYVRLIPGKEYAVASKTPGINWLFYSGPTIDSYSALHPSLVGTESYPSEGWGLPNSNYAQPAFVYTRRSLSTKVKLDKVVTMP